MSMTTIVASPPTFQSIPRIGWDGPAGNQGAFPAMSTEDVSRIFMPQRKAVTRSSSSSSLASNSSTSSTSTVTSTNEAFHATNGDVLTPIKKKQRGGFWPVSKAESTSSVTNTRVNGAVQPAASNGIAALSQKNGMQPAMPEHNGAAVNGVRTNGQSSAMLVLLPMNGTFERKQINVPMHPDPPQKIGRQTNNKTQPKPDNGYFDSKVLSRQHAEVWADANGRIWIRDVKSSNGTFVNGTRLSPENRESEPTELRQHDSLELGIDIVSEDQKTIVHHKVSAKVEFAGFPGKAGNALDLLNLGELDPSQGHSLSSLPMSAPMAHSRSQQGRPLNGRPSAASSVGGTNMTSVAQRQANYWGSSLNIEQLVKHVGMEMRAAKQQAHDLEQANTFLHSILPVDGSPAKVVLSNNMDGGQQAKVSNGRVKPPRIDHSARFADPPAPPPQHPLPEKPDSSKGASSAPTSFTSLLKRENTAKAAVNGASTSPTSPQSSQILTLIASLNEARQQIDSQGSKVKELEDMLRRERQAREAAEDKVKRLEESSSMRPILKVEEETGKPQEPSPAEYPVPTQPAESSDESSYKQRLEVMVSEMQIMQEKVNQITRRAETAENERSTFAAMIEQYRRERKESDVLEATEEQDSIIEEIDRSKTESGLRNGTIKDVDQANGHVRMPKLPEHLQQAVATVMQHQQSGGNLSGQSAPYVSMLGVVLIGVGLMAYLNSWQKGDK